MSAELPARLSSLLTPGSWRRIRRQLAPALRRELPADMPEPADRALEWLKRVLRWRRWQEAQAAEATWCPRISDIAKAADLSVDAVHDWAEEIGAEVKAGRITFECQDGAQAELDAGLAERVRNPWKAPPLSPEADRCSTVFLDKPVSYQRMLSRDAGPVPWRTMAFGQVGQVAAALTVMLGLPSLVVVTAERCRVKPTDGMVSVTELADLTDLENGDVRKMLADHGLRLRGKQKIERSWFGTDDGQAFWRAIGEQFKPEKSELRRTRESPEREADPGLFRDLGQKQEIEPG